MHATYDGIGIIIRNNLHKQHQILSEFCCSELSILPVMCTQMIAYKECVSEQWIQLSRKLISVQDRIVCTFNIIITRIIFVYKTV